MTQFSPAAEAIWKAYCDAIGHTAMSIYVPHDVALGAALRALADQVVPHLVEPDWGACNQMSSDIELYTDHQRKRSQILAIADELDWQGVPPDGTTGTEP